MMVPSSSILHVLSRITTTLLVVVVVLSLSMSLSPLSSFVSRTDGYCIPIYNKVSVNVNVDVDKKRNINAIIQYRRSPTQMMLGTRPPSRSADSFSSSYPSRLTLLNLHRQQSSSSSSQHPDEEGNGDESLSNESHEEDASRRRYLSSLIIPPLLTNLPSHPSTASAENPSSISKSSASSSKSSAVDLDREVDLKCLTNLPPVPSHMLRIYFCRHGQTENNRLRKVQGARVDPPINDNGFMQATNLGQAIALSLSSQQVYHSVPPKAPLIFSSNLQRAKMTAALVSQESSSSSSRNVPKQLSDLGEIDFGPVADGQPISKVQQKMTQAYTRWSIGQVDYRPDGGGESGRDVLQRASHAIQQLVDEAVSSPHDVSPSVIAVSHSGFLRVLLGIVLDESLLKAASRKVWNGSVTIIDVPRDFASSSSTSSSTNRVVGRRSKLLGGIFSQTPTDFQLIVPRTCTVHRVSEFRHLPPSTLIQ
mmetsp:Transcript_15137/g.37329  ORF Transcript_15137/g.37329 Transcript_15137/m.37329 type:complete len:478 (+) Transcript_15137:20-1453(+)